MFRILLLLFIHIQLVYSAPRSKCVLTVSNKPSLHSNDFVRTIAPSFSFKCNKNSVPPPTKPNGLLVANREKYSNNNNNDWIMEKY